MSSIAGPPAPLRTRLLSIERRISVSSNDSASAVAASEHSRRTSLRNELVAFKRALSTESSSTERLDLLSSSPGSPSTEEISLDAIEASSNRHAHVVIGMLACFCPTVLSRSSWCSLPCNQGIVRNMLGQKSSLCAVVIFSGQPAAHAYIAVGSVFKFCVACGDALVTDDPEPGHIRRWHLNPTTYEVKASYTTHSVHAGRITGIVYLDTKGVLVTSADDGHIKVWRPITFELIKDIESGCDHVSCLGKAGTDMVVSGESHAHIKPVMDIDVSQSGSMASRLAPAIPRAQAAICVWDVTDSWPLVQRIEGAHDRHVFSAAAVTHAYIASIGDDWKLRIWQRQSSGWTLSNEVDGREGSYLCLLSLDAVFGKPILATGGARGKLQVWDVASAWPLVASMSQTAIEELATDDADG